MEQPEVVLPPPAVRAPFYELAVMGDMQGIEQEATRLAAESDLYRPFAEQLLALAANFDDAGILALVRSEDEGLIDRGFADEADLRG